MRVIPVIFCFLTIQISSGQGQVELNDIAYEEFYKSQKTKDSLISELIVLKKEDQAFKTTFNKSEKTWKEFVDNQFKLKFPAFESWETRRQVYGSVFDMCYFQFLKLYTDLRIKSILDSFEFEGNICGE